MRNDDELQRAHDMLVGILLREAPFPDVGLTMRDLNLMAQVLCWVMEHDHNDQFPRILQRIQQGLQERGFVLERPQ